MPLVEQGLSKIPGLSGITSRQPQQPTYVENDFPEGFVIREYENGKEKNGGAETIVLKGPFMPHRPFTFGGEQRLVSEYYPGNSEPSVHVLGPKEKDLTIKGEIKLRKFKRVYQETKGDSGVPALSEVQVRQLAVEYQELIDAMRIRGNLVYLEMGEWHRWGFIESCSFDMETVAKIKYEVTFMIVGFAPPKNTKINTRPDTEMIAPNKDLTNAALAAIDQMQTFPANMPQSISDLLSTEIGKVASAIGLVTSFVDTALSDAEQLNSSVNRALGLIKNARSVLSVSIRRINAISSSVSNLGSAVTEEWQKTTTMIKSVDHIHKIRSNYSGLAALLASLSAKFAALRATVPLYRHLVQRGDTLQKLAIKYYNNADLWETIYNHNKLTTTDLVIGSVLEIPKV